MANAVDPLDLLDSFVEEVEGYLPTIAANLHRLLAQPGDEDLLEESHRFAHTIKSSAAMMGLPELRKLAVPMEALLARAYAGDVGITPAVAQTVEGTLDRVKQVLTAQRKGGTDVNALIRENDAAYAALQTAPPSVKPTPATRDDASDRLAHLDASSMGDLSLILAPGQRIDDNMLLGNDTASEPTPPPTSVMSEEAPEPPAPRSFEPEPSDLDLEAVEPEDAPMFDGRPRLTLLEGGQTTLAPDTDAFEQPTIAAEWLAELLDTMAARMTAPPVAESPTEPVPAPVEAPSAASPPTEPMAPPVAPPAPPPPSEPELALTRIWESRLAAERARFEELLEEERGRHRAEQQRLATEQQRALARTEEAHERALEEQRTSLEAQVQHYVEEELRPQIEEELREELAREFEVAALVDAGQAQPPTAAASRRVATPDDALAAEMRAIFAQEADEHLQAIGEHALALRARPDDVAHLGGLRRSVHTLKGAAATVGESTISSLCHQMESALDAALERQAALEETTFLLVMESCDALESLVHQRDGAVALVEELVARLSPLTGIAPVATPRPIVPDTPTPPDHPVPAAARSVVDVQAAYADTVLPVEQEAPVPAERNPAAGDDERLSPAAKGAGPALRMGLGQFDRVLGANHELIIAHAALEQRLQQLTQYVADLEQSGNRLRGAASRLEASRELASLMAGQPPALALPPGTWPATEREQSGVGPWLSPALAPSSLDQSAEFHALELDRYTEFHRLAGDVAEATLDVTILRTEMDHLLGDLRQLLVQQGRLHQDQNDVLLDVRTFPLQHLVPRVAQTVYAVASRLAKPCDFVVDGEQTLLDRAAMEPLADAILHLVRNAVDHGIESGDERTARGKPSQGTIRMAARREGPEVILTLSDDGGGLDVDRIRRSAIARGVIAADDVLSDLDVQQLIFAPGMSTAAAVTDLSGRGVGLDVVRTNIQALRGQVQVTSLQGAGTTFTLRLPSSLSLLGVALVGSGGNTYALPLALVRHVTRVPRRRVHTGENGATITHGGRAHPAIELSALLGVPASATEELFRNVLFLQGPSGTVALLVDQMVGTRSVVIKEVGRHLRGVHGVFGATVLGTGELVLILDLPALLSETAAPALPAVAPKVLRSRRVLVVDDSASVRHLVSSLFQRQGWETQPARDGQEALATVATWRPDAVVTDIEMPRMDGYELLAILKRQPETADIPVVIVTSRSGEKHREKARQLGVDAYLVKPYQEEELIGTVEALAFGDRARRRAAG